MDVHSFCQHLKTVVSSAKGQNSFEVLANELAAFFGVKPHEVGLFKMDSAERLAKFVWPENRLRHNIEIPINSFVGSLVSKVAKERAGLMDNAFASSSHLHMFENALTEKEHCIALQKIMAAPGLNNGKLCWIIQVSRKGKTLDEAGPDFTPKQLKDLEIISAQIATLTF